MTGTVSKDREPLALPQDDFVRPYEQRPLRRNWGSLSCLRIKDLKPISPVTCTSLLNVLEQTFLEIKCVSLALYNTVGLRKVYKEEETGTEAFRLRSPRGERCLVPLSL